VGLLQVIAPAAGSLVRFICSRRSAGTDLKTTQQTWLIDYAHTHTQVGTSDGRRNTRKQSMRNRAHCLFWPRGLETFFSDYFEGVKVRFETPGLLLSVFGFL